MKAFGPTQEAIRVLALHPAKSAMVPVQSPPSVPRGTSPEDVVLRRLMQVMGAPPETGVHGMTAQTLLEALTRGHS